VTALETRGLVEGFYGRPWTLDQRLDMIDFVAELGMNTFVYSPKHDPATRREWRTPLAGEASEELRLIVAHARERGVALWYGLSPGLSMRYSDQADRRAIETRFDQLRELGVSDIALFLDDIPGRLQHPEDRAVFADLTAAQLAVITPVEERLAATGARLTVCPTDYWGRPDAAGLAAFGSGLAPQTRLFWTGRAICSAELDAADADVFAAATGRRPLYWDNFPVNDVAMTHELHIGPYTGRDAALAGRCEGIIANPMPLAEASKIGLAGVAAFCLDPEGFDAEAAWERAIRRVAGPRDAEDVREFADAFRGSALCADDAPRLGEVLERFAFRYEFENRADAVAELRDELAQRQGVADRMTRIDNVALRDEVTPWVAQYARGIEALLAVADGLDTTGAGGPPLLRGEARDGVARRLADYRATGLRAFGDLVDMFLSDQIGEFALR
jgi:hyaluronoglucosaminidase